ncbi:MAG: hypothetical protein R3F24_04390 [Gammaproteobacteria bacterium]
MALAITTFDTEAIEAQGINNLQDIASLTPGLSFLIPGRKPATPVIRGIVPDLRRTPRLSSLTASTSLAERA